MMVTAAVVLDVLAFLGLSMVIAALLQELRPLR